MEVYLFGAAALVAFVLAGAPVLLWAYIRRERELRAALKDSLTRIAELEAQGGAAETPPAPPKVSEIKARAPPASEPRSAGEFAWRAPDSVVEPPTSIPPPQRREIAHREPPPPAAESEPPQEAPASDAPHHSLAPYLVAGALTLAATSAVAAGLTQTLSPAAALILALLAGAAALAAEAWFVRATPHGVSGASLRLLAATGLVILAAAALAALHGRATVLPPVAVFVLIAALCAASFAYAQRHGKFLCTLAIAFALAAPAFAPLDSAWVLFRHGLLIGALIYALRAPSVDPPSRWMMIAGALGWAFEAALTQAGDPIAGAAAAANLFALIAIGGALLWPIARTPAPLRIWTAPFTASPLFRMGAALNTAGVCGLAFLLASSSAIAPMIAAICVALAAALAAAAAFAESLAAFAVFAYAVLPIALLLWPAGDLTTPALAFTAACLALIGAVGGWLIIARAREPVFGALLAALGPVAILLAAYLRLNAAGGTDVWSGAFAILAGLALLFHVRMRGVSRGIAAASAFALGAVVAAGAAIAIATPPPYNIGGLALLAPVLALFDHPVDQRGLRLGASLCAAAAIALALAQFFTQTAHVAAAPWLDLRALALLLSGALFYLAAFLFARGGARSSALSVQTLTLLAFAAAALALALEARHLAVPGAHAAPVARLWEAGAYACLLLAFAASVLERAPDHPLQRDAQILALALAAALSLGWTTLVLSPWWGAAPTAANGWPLLNELLAAYAAPAAIFLGYGWLCARRGRYRVANIAAAASLALAFIWLTLELRRVWHGPAMHSAPIGEAEAWSYSALWLLCAGALLLLGLWRKSRAFETAALLLAFTALAKAALLDAAPLSGAARIVTLAALALAAAACLVLYNRRALAEAAARRADPNLLPPRLES